MSKSEQVATKESIDELFREYYRENYKRFARMYDGWLNSQGETVGYLSMLPPKIREEIAAAA